MTSQRRPESNGDQRAASSWVRKESYAAGSRSEPGACITLVGGVILTYGSFRLWRRPREPIPVLSNMNINRIVQLSAIFTLMSAPVWLAACRSDPPSRPEPTPEPRYTLSLVAMSASMSLASGMPLN